MNCEHSTPILHSAVWTKLYEKVNVTQELYEKVNQSFRAFISLTLNLNHLTHIALECIWPKDLSAPCPLPCYHSTHGDSHMQSLSLKDGKAEGDIEHIILFHS